MKEQITNAENRSQIQNLYSVVTESPTVREKVIALKHNNWHLWKARGKSLFS
jgi:hypothetical protein